MKKLLLYTIFMVGLQQIQAQVGINTTTPDPSSMLDIEATDKGMLVPRVSLPNVTSTQLDGTNTAADGLLIYNTNPTTVGGSGVGFYVFNGTTWDRVTTSADGIGGSDADFFEEGTTDAPDNINDDIYTLGNVAIGKNTANYPLDIDATSLRGINNVIRGTDNTIRYGFYNEIANTGTGDHYGFYNLMAGTSNATKYGLYNFITNSGSAPQFGVRNQIINAGTGNKYGTFNNIAAFNANAVYATYNFVDGGTTGDRFGNYNQISNTGTGRLYGSYTTLGGAGTGIKFGDYITVANSVPGTHYGVYSDVIKAGSFAGYFRGNLAVGTTDFTSGTPNYYVFPSSRGTANQIMQTDGSGNVSWVDASSISGDDADFYEVGGTNPPDNINDDIYTLGALAVGDTSNDESKLNVTTSNLENYNNGLKIDLASEISSGALLRGIDIQINSDGTSTPTNASGLEIENNSNAIVKTGIVSTVSNVGGTNGKINLVLNTSNQTTSTGNITGIYNTVTVGGGSGFQFGVRQRLLDLIGSSGGTLFGYNSDVLNNGTGPSVGFYSLIQTNNNNNAIAFDAAFNGNSGLGNKYGLRTIIPSTVGGTNHYGVYAEALRSGTNTFAGYFLGNVSIGTTTANNYILPASRGTNGQVMQTDGSGNVSWIDPSSITNNSWSINGNAGTNATTNFIGTTDNIDLSFRRNNLFFGRLSVNNLSLGSFAQSLITTGIYNTSIGNGANRSLTTGSQNTAIGNLANFSNVISDNNTAVGARALQDNTLGENNVAMGVVASYRNTSGSRNVSLGDGALQENETGSNNVSIGYFSALVKETSNNNVFIGSFAGYDNSGAYNSSNNVMIGSNAGRSSQNATGNIFIGYNAGIGVTTNNRLYIENSSSAAPLLYGEFDNDILRTYGDFQVNDPSNTGQSGLLQNDDNFVHAVDANLDFGFGGNHIMLSSQEGIGETGGIHLDGDNAVIWSPGDGGRSLRILDEDFWADNDGNPFNNTAEIAYIDNNGQFVQASDQNRKQNIQKINNALNSITQLNGYTYEYKTNAEEKAKGEKPTRTSGVLAQELQKVLPEAVQVSEYGEYFVHYAGITPLLIEAIKELKTENETLKQNQTQLEARLAAIEAKLNKD